MKEEPVRSNQVMEAKQWCPSPPRAGGPTAPQSWFPLGSQCWAPAREVKLSNFHIPEFPEYSFLLLKKEKKKNKGKKKASLTFSVASQAGGKGQDKWILSRSLACGAHSLYCPARAWLGEVINAFRLEQGAHCWSLDPLLGWQWKIQTLVEQGPPLCPGGLLSIHL